MEGQTPQEDPQIFENIDFNSSPEEAKEQIDAGDQVQVRIKLKILLYCS